MELSQRGQPDRTSVDERLQEFASLLSPATWKEIAHDVSETYSCAGLMCSADPIPWSDEGGVYYFTDAQGSVKYVGSAVIKKFGHRFWDHVGKVRQIGEWGTVTGFAMIRFSKHLYLAAGLERYILALEKPSLNQRR